uniref:Receptor for retinol uptake STRA6 n=1 Tax=Plectus sambesii TaxID=2011161 RepID=A0A914XW37_9BILA
MDIRATVTVANHSEANSAWNEMSNSTSSPQLNLTEWSHESHKVDANTKCVFLFATLGHQQLYKDNIIYVQVLPAVLLIIFFAFVARSGPSLHSFLQCSARVPVPVRLNEQREHRGLICAAFGIAVWTVVQIIFSGKSVYEWSYDDEFHAMLMILNCLLAGIVYWPVMAAINTEYLPGQIIGCIYVWWCTICAVLISLPCEFFKLDIIMVGVQMLPLYGFLLYICVAMPIRIIRGIRERGNQKTGNWVEQNKGLYQVRHVRRMFRLTVRKKSMMQDVLVADSSKKPFGFESIKKKIVEGNDEEKAESEKTREEKDLDVVNEREKKILNARFYKVLPGFRYSLNILVAVTITQTAIFLLAVSGLRYHTVLLDATIKFIEALTIVMSATPHFLTGNKTAPIIDIVEKLDNDSIRDYARTPIIASIVFAYLLNLLAMFLTMRNYRKHLVYLFHGQHAMIPEYNKIKSAAGILTSSTTYIGYQLGYGIYAYFVQMFWLVLILGGLWANVILVVVYGRTKIIGKILKHTLPVIAYYLVMRIGQKLLVYHFFCQKRDRKKDTKVLAIDNRHCYMNYHYIMIFFNAPLGIFNAFARVLKILAFSLWTMPRCDIPSISREFEIRDSGFRTYVCMLEMENAMTNPLLIVFVHHLLDAVRHSNGHPEDMTGTKHDEQEELALDAGGKRPSVQLSPRSKSARNRWHLLYTLYRNPILRACRTQTTILTLPMVITFSRERGSLDIKQQQQLLEMEKHEYTPERRKSRDNFPPIGHGRPTIIRVMQNPERY